MIGEFEPGETNYETTLHSVLYLIRRKYYGEEYFPIKTDSLLITEENFKRAPKRTTVLLIDRELFIGLTPERTGKEVHNDTLLFHNLVFNRGFNLLRSKKLFFRYSQRTNLLQFTDWLFHRGVRFTDFYLRPGGYFFTPFRLLSTLSLAAIIAALLIPNGLRILLGSACTIDAALALYLSENKRDLPRVFFGLAIVISIFASGVAVYWVRKLRSVFSACIPARKRSR